MRKLALPILLVALTLTGCSAVTTDSAPGEPAAKAPTATAAPTPSPTPTPTVNARGNLPKVVGQVFGLVDADRKQASSFVADAITVDPACTGAYPRDPENGHFLKVDFTGETYANLPDRMFFGGGAWKAITDAGTTVNADPVTMAAMSCINDDQRLPNPIGPGEKVVGSVILDVPTEHGSIVLTWDGVNGWEWSY